MKEKLIKTNKLEKGMKKTIMLTITLLLASSGFAIFGLFEKPLTSLDIISLHTIYNDINATGQSYATVCSPIHFQVPYKQTHDTTYVELGYVPICDVNQSDYPDHAITLYCESEYVKSWNYTANCEDSSYVYDSEWVSFEHRNENSSAVFFQSDTATSVFSCMFCVNDTGVIPNRTDFWIRAENTGNRVEITNQTVEVFPQLTNVVTLIDNIIIFINSLIVLAIGLFGGLSPIWIMFAMILFAVFLFIQLRRKARQLAKGK